VHSCNGHSGRESETVNCSEEHFLFSNGFLNGFLLGSGLLVIGSGSTHSLGNKVLNGQVGVGIVSGGEGEESGEEHQPAAVNPGGVVVAGNNLALLSGVEEVLHVVGVGGLASPVGVRSVSGEVACVELEDKPERDEGHKALSLKAKEEGGVDQRSIETVGVASGPEEPVETVKANGGSAEVFPGLDLFGFESPDFAGIVSSSIGETDALVLNPVDVPGLDPGTGNDVHKKASTIKVRVKVEGNGFLHVGFSVTHHNQILLLFNLV
jgi:hypothetical protein